MYHRQGKLAYQVEDCRSLLEAVFVVLEREQRTPVHRGPA